eukprot:2409027-Pyramimonas_sp.AAC.1
MEIAQCQHSRGRFFIFERPQYASSWGLEVAGIIGSLPEVTRLRIDMCTVSLQGKKPTGLLSDHRRIIAAMTGRL